MAVATCQIQSLHKIAGLFGLKVASWRSLRSIYCVTDEAGVSYAIKPFRQGLSNLNLVVLVQRWAELNTPSFLPPLRLTDEGKPFLTYRGNHYLCLTWFPGRELDYLKEADRKRAVFTLERWRQAGIGSIVPKPLRRWMERSVNWENQIQEMKICRRMAERATSSFGRLYLRDWEFFYRAANDAWEALQKSDFQEYALEAMQRGELFHGDWAHHNLLLRPDGEVSMLDLEYIHGDLHLMNCVDLLMRFLQLDRGDCRGIPRFFDWCKKDLKLSPDEKEIFKILMGWPTDFWMLGRQYFIEQLPKSESYSTMRYLRKVSPLRWSAWKQGIYDALRL